MAAQWGWHIDQDQEGQAAMPLAERIRQLRKEACLSHAEFADKIGTDPGRVSRYEAGRLTPSAEALVRIAETLNVSIDHLLVDGIPRRPLHAAQDALGDRLAAVAELPADDLAALLNIIQRARRQEPPQNPRRRPQLSRLRIIPGGAADGKYAQPAGGSNTGFGRKSPTIWPSALTFQASRIAVAGTASSGP
jgi:transcriptional regulator with XRE-family HTH domain